jgi:hypothetical protein
MWYRKNLPLAGRNLALGHTWHLSQYFTITKKNLVTSPRAGSTPRHTDWPTVGRNVTRDSPSLHSYLYRRWKGSICWNNDRMQHPKIIWFSPTTSSVLIYSDVAVSSLSNNLLALHMFCFSVHMGPQSFVSHVLSYKSMYLRIRRIEHSPRWYSHDCTQSSGILLFLYPQIYV